MARVLFHVDLNAFFASCEELKNPSLKGKPMAVGSLSKRGVLSTANSFREIINTIDRSALSFLSFYVNTRRF